MGKREDMVEEIVIDVCNNCFCKGLFDKGRKILQKLYLSDYNYIDNMHTRRNLLYRLIVAERNCNENYEKALEMHVRQLKDDMDNTPNYKEENTGEYLDMMSYYTDCEYIILTNEELVDYYNFSCDYWNNRYEKTNMIEYYMWSQVAKFNKGRLLRNFKLILDCFRNLHSINNERTLSTIKQMLNDIQCLDKQLYGQVLSIINEKSVINI